MCRVAFLKLGHFIEFIQSVDRNLNLLGSLFTSHSIRDKQIILIFANSTTAIVSREKN